MNILRRYEAPASGSVAAAQRPCRIRAGGRVAASAIFSERLLVSIKLAIGPFHASVVAGPPLRRIKRNHLLLIEELFRDVRLEGAAVAALEH